MICSSGMYMKVIIAGIMKDVNTKIMHSAAIKLRETMIGTQAYIIE